MKKHLPSVVKFLTIMLGMWLLTFALVSATKSKFDGLRSSQAEVASAKIITAGERERQLRCLAQNIYWEAASEPFEGKVAVAQVTMNRAASSNFPNDICAVVYQKNIVYQKVVCQFSWYCEGTHRVKKIYPPLYRESEEVAKKVLLENFRLSGLKHAMYYHADYVKPNWKKTPIAQIGHHVFYAGN
jgi:spore germination cell wall hydrolase CwlJ-like protein